MKLNLTIDSQLSSIDLTREGSRVVAEVGGRRYDLTIGETSDEGFIITHGTRTFRCHALAKKEDSTCEVIVRHQSFQVAIDNPKRLARGGASGANASGQIVIKAQMPGRVVRVLIEQGAQVEANETVLVVEAMKMQNEMKAPRAGTVKEIKIAEGATVNAGDVLAIIE